MRVLQILPELHAGGVERGTIDLAKYLQKMGHYSAVVSAGGRMAGDLSSAGITHYTLPVHKKSIFWVIYSIREIIKIVRAEKIDLIHARSRVPALIAYFVSRRAQVPFITTCHGFYSRHLLSLVMGWGKLVIVASHVIGRRMHDDFKVPFEKLRFIPRGVNLDEFSYRERTPDNFSKDIVIGLVGRLTPIKGHSLFLKAMARVARVHPSVKIQIIGDAPKPQYKEELISLVRHLGMTACVEFLGTRYDIPDLLSKMTVLVAPSVGEEAFGRVVIEAGAAGVPVVATRMGGMVDIVEDEKNGLLVPADDPRILADAVLRYLKDPDFARSCAKALREKVEKEFSLDLMFQKTVAVYDEAVVKKKILVIKLSALGDVILIIPSLRALRRQYPGAWISVLVGRKARNIIRNCPYVDDVIVHEDSASPKIVSWWRTARILAEEDFDTVVDLQNNRASHFMAFFCGARLRAGHHNRKWSFLLNRRTKNIPPTLAPIEHQFHVLKLLGMESFDKKLELWTRKDEEERIHTFLQKQWVSPSQTLIGINPGSSVRWATKQWPVENFSKLCDELAKKNIRVVITGSGEDRVIAEEIMRLTRNKPINAVGKTSITELAALIRRCQAFISSDSAPMHVASSVGVPLVALFGPTDPKRHLVPPPKYQVFWKELQCSPCYLRACPIGHPCMKKITVQEVLETALEFAATS